MGHQATQSAMPKERRHHARQAVIGPELISVDVGPDETFGLLTNLAEQGAAMQTFAPLRPGSIKTLRWKFSAEDTPIEVRAEVIWSSNQMSGLRFLDLDAEDRARVAQWLESFAGSDMARPEGSPIEPVISSNATDLEFELDILTRRARLLTRADGAAIAIASGGAFVCLASRGSAPGYGVTLQVNSGLSGEAVRTGRTTCCVDTQTDPRVDAEACRELDVRSVVVVPIQHAGKVLGIVECLWSEPQAYTEVELAQLDSIAETVVALLHPDETPTTAGPAAVSPPLPKSATVPPLEAVAGPSATVIAGEFARPERGTSGSDDLKAEVPLAAASVGQQDALSAPEQFATWTTAGETTQARGVQRYAIIAVAAMVVLAGAVGIYMWRLRSVRARNQAQPPAQAMQTPTDQAPVPPAQAPPSASPSPRVAATISESQKIKPPAATSSEGKVADDEPEVRITPMQIRTATPREAPVDAPSPPPLLGTASDGQTLARLASSSTAVPKLAPPAVQTITAPELVRKVQPRYPPPAASRRITGTVILEAVITSTGRVKRVQILSGHPMLAEAARAAVVQWRYKPAILNGAPVESTVQVAVNFGGTR
ncbi:MAG: TonB family protein [Terriglobales bacterium]